MAAEDIVLPPLLEDDVLLRALLRKSEIEDPRSAFFIREIERDTGLSVNIKITPEQCRALFNKTYGVRSMELKDVTALDLEVIPDAPHHANIRGIPHTDDDPKRAEFLAGELLKISTLISEGLVKNR